jgi:hypothetical protein
MTRQFIDTQDLSVAELRQLLELIETLRAADRDRCIPQLLRGCARGPRPVVAEAHPMTPRGAHERAAR